MDTWLEERREVLESVLAALANRPEGAEAAACSLLLRHLISTASRMGQAAPDHREYEFRLLHHRADRHQPERHRSRRRTSPKSASNVAR